MCRLQDYYPSYAYRLDLMATSSLSARLSARLASPEASFVVMGASRGIGLAMVKDLLARSRGSVFAASRNALQSPHLTDLAAKHPSRLIPVQCDMLDPSSIAAMAKSVAACHTRLDCLINVAGVLHEGALKPEKSLAAVKEESMITVLRTNAVGPVLVAQTLQPLLGDGSVVANVSARVGSIGDNGLGGWWSYRMSKAALNMGESSPCGMWALMRMRVNGFTESIPI